MEGAGNVKILFVAGFGPIVRDTGESRRLYGEVLGIPFKVESGSYLHTEALQGAKTFALWPLSQAAQSCFGKDKWPDAIPVPQARLEFDVDNVEEATGYPMSFLRSSVRVRLAMSTLRRSTPYVRLRRDRLAG